MQLSVLSTLHTQQGLSNASFQPGSQEALEKSHSQAVEAYAIHLLNVVVTNYYHSALQLNYSEYENTNS